MDGSRPAADELERQRAMAGMLFRISTSFSGELDLQRLLQMTTDEATNVCNAEFGAFFFNRQSRLGDEYRLYAFSGASRPFDRLPMPRVTELFRPVFEGRQVCRKHDVTKDPAYASNSPLTGIPVGHVPVRSYLAVPVVSKSGETFGGLFLGHSKPGVFTAEDETLVIAVAAHAAIAIDNAQLLAKSRDAESRYRELADAMPQIVWTAGLDGRVEYFNKRWYDFTGYDEAQSLDHEWMSILHPDDVPRCKEIWGEAVRNQSDYEIQYRFRDRANDTYRWYLARGYAIADETGKAVRWIGTCTDIHKQKSTEQALKFLAEASKELTTLAEENDKLHRLVSLAVPDFADCSVAGLATEEGKIERIAVAHVDAEKGRRFLQSDVRHAFSPSVKDGDRLEKTQFISVIPRHVLEQTADTPEQLRILSEMAFLSYISVPLTVRGRLYGVLTFFTSDSGRHYDEDDVAVAEDVGRRASIAIENGLLYKSLRQADQRKDEFLAMLAHELRNPLAPIRHAAYILGMPGIGQDAAEEARSIVNRQLEHMVRLVDDLLDVSRIMRGKIDLRISLTPLQEIAERTLETAKPLIEQNGRRIVASIPEEPIWLNADPVRMAQVVSNLLNNSAKYTDEGGLIRLSVRRDGRQAVISVSDDGIGIDASLLPHVFDLFTQADNSRDRTVGGLGIGLTLVKRLVEMHGGVVEAKSPGIGAGSEFIIRLPVADPGCPPTSRENQTESESQQSSTLRQGAVRVLVVDDSVDSANSLARILHGWGHEARVLHDGSEVEAIVRQFRPHVVLLDIGLPGRDGYAIASDLRREPENADLTLVAMTGYGAAKDRQLSRNAGIDFHLVKPIELASLQRLLANENA